MSTALAADVLAKTGEAAKAGPIAFAVILVLCVACYFLFKSMSKHLKRVRENFPADPAATAQTSAVQTSTLEAPTSEPPTEPQA